MLGHIYADDQFKVKKGEVFHGVRAEDRDGIASMRE